MDEEHAVHNKHMKIEEMITFNRLARGSNRMKNIIIILMFAMSIMAFSSQRGKNVAIVKLAKGTASVTNLAGETTAIQKGMWIEEGAIIKTAPKSFVRLSFVDKSSMNVGPKSELKIEKFSKKEAGVINVLTGKIRSQVTKDYLQMDKDKSKLFVKSKNAVMGVRGTDFMFSTNRKTGNTTTVLFEGAIVFNKLPKGGAADLESVVNKGRKILPGQVSVALRNKPVPTVPAKLNSKQFAKLQNNISMLDSDVKKAKRRKSPVPPGLTGDIVANDPVNLKEEIKKIVKVEVAEIENKKIDMEVSKGFKDGLDEKPADGVMVHVETGAVIQPANDAVFDNNTGEWVSSTMGDINAAGEYIPPEQINITSDGSFVTETNDGKMAVIPGMGESIVPVDQMVSFDDAPKVELPPEIAIQVEQDLKTQDAEGPTPAGSVDDLPPPSPEDFKAPEGPNGDPNQAGDLPPPIIPEDFNDPTKAGDLMLNPDGSPAGPAPAGNLDSGNVCANCVPVPIGQPVTTNPTTNAPGQGGAPPPPPPGTTKIRVKVD